MSTEQRYFLRSVITQRAKTLKVEPLINTTVFHHLVGCLRSRFRGEGDEICNYGESSVDCLIWEEVQVQHSSLYSGSSIIIISILAVDHMTTWMPIAMNPQRIIINSAAPLRSTASFSMFQLIILVSRPTTLLFWFNLPALFSVFGSSRQLFSEKKL